MPRWKALPEELDPQIREFTGQLRRLVDRSGLGLSAIADKTGYSKTSWEKYLNGRLLPPRGATQALAEVTGTEIRHLAVMWELAERAWSRAEMRHDMTLEAIQVEQARAALSPTGETPVKGTRRARTRGRPPASPPDVAPGGPGAASAQGDEGTAVLGRRATAPSAGNGAEAAGGRGAPTPPVPGAGASAAPGPAAPLAVPPGAVPPGSVLPGAVQPGGRPGQAAGGGQRRRAWGMAAVGAVAALIVVAGAALAYDLTGGESAADAPPSPTAGDRDLPAGVECSGRDCTGKDPERMGCGGQYAKTAGSGWVGRSLVEVRYSEVCGAAWARVTGAADGDSLEIAAGGRSRSVDVADGDDDAYTPMVASPRAARARACTTLAAGGDGCVRGGEGLDGTGTSSGADEAGTNVPPEPPD